MSTIKPERIEHRPLPLLSKALLLAISISMSAMPAWAQALSAQELTSMLRDSNAAKRAADIRVVGAGPAATVLCQKNQSVSDKELKIDAIFLAKALVDAAPNQIQSVKVLFSQSGRDGKHVTVTRKDIEDYGSGKISPEALLATLKVVSMEPDRGPDIVQGPDMERRLLVWQRIERLRKEGTGVKPFEMIFREIEDLAKTGDATKTAARIVYIESKLTEQEDHLKQAKMLARGLGVRSQSGSTSQPSTTTAMRSTTAMPTAGGAPYLPPEAEQVHLKSIFMQQADNMVRQVQAKNAAAGQTVSDLKKKIDQLFAAKRDAEAFANLHQFQIQVMQTTGIDIFRPGPQAESTSQQPPQQGQSNRASNNGPSMWGQPQGQQNSNFGPPGQGPPGGGPPGGGFGPPGPF